MLPVMPDRCSDPSVREYDVEAYPIVYAYGDTHEMLGMAHRKYFRWKEVPPC